MSSLGFGADLDSGRRILAMAAPEKKLAAFTQFARAGVRWYLVGGLPKPDVVDALRDLGVEAGLTEEEVQAGLAEAASHPFVLPSGTAPSSTTAKPNGSANRPRSQLVIRRASEIEPKAVEWLWKNRLPLGKVTIVAGEPGLGKSQLTCAIAAAVTTGGPFPCDEGTAPRGSVIILSAEDDVADTIRPRLDAAGARADRVLVVSAVRREDGSGRRTFSLQDDLVLLEGAIERAGDTVLVVIDPVSSYLGKVDSHKNAELRAVLEPLGEMAARLGVAILAITHLSKSGSGSANNRFIGSIAFVAAARAAYIVARDRDDKDRRLFIPTKNNVGPEGTGLAFRVQLVEIASGIMAPMIIWEGPVSMTAEDALAVNTSVTKSDVVAPGRKTAEELLRTILAEGPLPMRQIEAEAKAAGISWATVRRARDTLGLIVSKAGLDGGWEWKLPGQRQTDEDAH